MTKALHTKCANNSYVHGFFPTSLDFHSAVGIPLSYVAAAQWCMHTLASVLLEEVACFLVMVFVDASQQYIFANLAKKMLLRCKNMASLASSTPFITNTYYSKI